MRSKNPDTPADIELRECLAPAARQNFVMVAGAGSGKTTSLVKGLAYIVAQYGPELRKLRQSVGCITYTEIAAKEIQADVGNDDLVHVSTIHSFMWRLVRSFQRDLREWVAKRIDEKIQKLREEAASFGPRVQPRTRAKNQRNIERYEAERGRIAAVKSFTYGTGSDYSRGVLGHDDVIRVATEFLMERQLFRALLAQQYPFLFVDESQDTAPEVVLALKAVAAQMNDRFCLGFFGDPMQQIYATGIGPVKAETGWRLIEKPENFRSATSVLSAANAIRAHADRLVQIRGRQELTDQGPKPVAGTARMFVLPADAHRDQRLGQVRAWLAARNNQPQWLGDDVKVLVIVHRMAADRLGFGTLYAAMNDQAPSAFKDGFLDATSWPLRPLMKCALPLAEAVRTQQEFAAMTLLRQMSPLLVGDAAKAPRLPAKLAALRASTFSLAQLIDPAGAANIRQVLLHLREHCLATLEARLVSYLDATPPQPQEPPVEDGEELTREIQAMDRFLQCPAKELWGYRTYVSELSPFSTQQGIKGAEYERVLVIADDEEGTHTQFSYDKYFGIKPLTAGDHENLAAGKETQVERTRRLFYVCCTRAKRDLAVVWFTNEIAAARTALQALHLFPADQIFTDEQLR